MMMQQEMTKEQRCDEKKEKMLEEGKGKQNKKETMKKL